MGSQQSSLCQSRGNNPACLHCMGMSGSSVVGLVWRYRMQLGIYSLFYSYFFKNVCAYFLTNGNWFLLDFKHLQLKGALLLCRKTNTPPGLGWNGTSSGCCPPNQFQHIPERWQQHPRVLLKPFQNGASLGSLPWALEKLCITPWISIPITVWHSYRLLKAELSISSQESWFSLGIWSRRGL